MKEDKIMALYKRMCDVDTDFDALKSILDHDSTLHKSKYIKKYLNLQAKNNTSKFYRK